MEHVIAAFALSIALLASGVLHTLVRFWSPRRREALPGARRRPWPAGARPGPKSSSVPRVRARATKKRSSAQPSLRPRAVTDTRDEPKTMSPAPTRALVAGSEDVRTLAERLSRLEQALQAEASSVAPSAGISPTLRGHVVDRFRKGVSLDDVALEVGLSRGEVELMLKMQSKAS